VDAYTRRCEEVKLERAPPPNQRYIPRMVVYDVFPRPNIDLATHVIRVRGLVKRELNIPVRRMMSEMPCVELVADFHCVTGWSVAKLRWRGTPTRAILEEAGAEGRYVLAIGADGYSATLPIDALVDEPSIVAWGLNGGPIPPHHGYVRLVAPLRYGWKSVKYLTELLIVDEPVPGYWEALGYSVSGDPWREERLAVPVPRRVEVPR